MTQQDDELLKLTTQWIRDARYKWDWHTKMSEDVARELLDTICPIIAKEEIEKVLDSVELQFREELFSAYPLSKYEDTVALLNLKKKKWEDFRQAMKGKSNENAIAYPKREVGLSE